MSREEFRFKQFSVRHENSAMRVNTDGVLLGAWTWTPCCSTIRRSNILDIGTGCGIIALMLAQRLSHNYKIYGIEIDSASAVEATYNFGQSAWADTLCCVSGPLSNFIRDNKDARYDLIITNPPYFNDSLKSPEERKSITRHTDQLSYSEIIDVARHHLKTGGRLSLILPESEYLLFDQQVTSMSDNLLLTRLCRVRTIAMKTPKRVLLEYLLTERDTVTAPIIEESLVIQNSNRSDDFTEEYKSLTKDFYLKF